ncbi:MAG: DNA recombination protein RmuC [bacterium]
MNSWAIYVLLTATVVLLVAVLVRLSRRSEAGVPEQTLATLLDSLKSLSAVESQVGTLANAHSSVVQNLNKLEVGLKGLETKFAETSGDVKQAISRDVGDARKVLVELKTRFEDQTKRDDDIHAVTRRIERVIVGARTRGASGENVLAEAFAQFPPEMMDKNFRVASGKVVEFAMVLPNKKRLPIDSKWSGLDAIDRMETETDPARVKRLEDEVEKAVQKKIKEVVLYIDPSCTTTIAIAAVPDSVYGLCKKAHIEAFKVGVLLMAYSMVVPYVLALYHLHLQFSRSVDFENIEAYITKIERSLDEVDAILENRFARAGVMVANAYSESKTILGSMRAATAFLRELPGAETGEGPESPATAGESPREAALPGSAEGDAGDDRSKAGGAGRSAGRPVGGDAATRDPGRLL